MVNKGWICIHRQIQDCSIWCDDDPFDRRSAWIDLLLSANHADKEILFNGSPLVIKKGQLLTSVRKLAERWRWSNDRTLRYLRLLESLEMITKESDRSRTLIRINKYEVYQDLPNTENTVKSAVSKDLPNSNKYSDKYSDKYTDKSQTTMINNETILNNTLSSEISEIVSYLNTKCGTNFSKSTEKTRKLIKARFNDGYKVEDFKKVIDIKFDDWSDKPDMRQFLRPETLFGNKFEGYLNQKVLKKQKGNQFNEMIHTDYDMDALEKLLLEGR